MAENNVKRSRGRPKKYQTEEERKAAILLTSKRPERKAYCYNFLKRWRYLKRIDEEIEECRLNHNRICQFYPSIEDLLDPVIQEKIEKLKIVLEERKK